MTLSQKVHRQIYMNGKSSPMPFQKFSMKEQTDFVKHCLSLSHMLDKLEYAKRLVGACVPALPDGFEYLMPYEDLLTLYDKSVEMHPKLDYPNVLRYIKAQISPEYYKRNEPGKKLDSQPQEEEEHRNLIDFHKKISKTDFSELEQKIREDVLGQEDAIRLLLSPMISVKHKGWPQDGVNAAYLMGPSGVGKTSSIKSLTRLLGIPMLYVPGSEYMERHTKVNLIGSPKSYVGYDTGGILPNFLYDNPESIILVDEVDKIHPEVFTTLHNFLGDGYVQDSDGRQFPMDEDGNSFDKDGSPLKFKGFVYFTSNTGNKLSESGLGRSIGFSKDDGKTKSELDKERIKKILELNDVQKALIGRINSFVNFSVLPPNILRDIFDKQIREENRALQYFRIRPTKATKEKLITLGNPDDFGARNISKNIARCLIDPLCYEFEMNQIFDKGRSIKVVPTDDGFAYYSGEEKVLEKRVADFGF